MKAFEEKRLIARTISIAFPAGVAVGMLILIWVGVA